MTTSRAAIESVFRAKCGELCASLVTSFSYQRFDLVEDALQSAFQRALEKWPQTGIPQNPAGWLYAVARNICLEALRHAAVVDRTSAGLKATTAAVTTPDEEMALAIPGGLDDFAAMILLCCNPDVSEKSQLCLMLKSGLRPHRPRDRPSSGHGRRGREEDHYQGQGAGFERGRHVWHARPPAHRGPVSGCA